MTLVGRILVIAGLSLLFLAYSNFVPNSLRSKGIADYVKNHFVREVIFGIALTALSIYLATGDMESSRWWQLAFFGSVVVLPFWIAAAFGWSTGGISEVWGREIGPATAYRLHGTQVALFYTGLIILRAA